MRWSFRTSFVAAAVAALSAPASAAPLLHIVAAENFYGDLAKQIGGKHVEVTSILSNPDEDPHLFETSASAAKALSSAEVVVYNGIDYDPWMDKLLSASKKADRSTIVAADLVGAKSGDNPHLWYDPRTLPAVAAAIAEKLEKRDPKDAAEFKANLAAFQKSFAPIASEVDDIKTKNHDITVTATEPVFGYMAKALGFMMVNYDFQVAIMNNAEPSPSQVSAFEDSLKSGKVKILFFNKQVSEKTTERLRKIAEDSKVAIVGVTETEPKDLKIQAWFMGQLNEVKTALAGHAM